MIRRYSPGGGSSMNCPPLSSIRHTSSLPTQTWTWGGSNILSETLSKFDYTEYTFTVNALSPATQLQFQFSSIFGNVFYLDDISVTPPAGVPDGGSTVSLLGFALLGVAVLRRKLRW